MFRFLELSLHGWDLWPPVRVPLERDVILVSGPNGSGKTTLLDAVRQLMNAPLSSKRRLQHYIRRPDAPALLRAVVSNDAGEGSPQPFRAERITTKIATLACALLPGSGGAPEKRFVILPGRASIDDVRSRLLDGRDWYGPDQYARALEHAGVTRSLMSILATEQGRTNALFEVKPRDLFQKVLEMLGERQILERYRGARRKYEDARTEVGRQNGALVQRQVQLQRVQRDVAQLNEWEEAETKVRELEEHLPAADLQGLLKRCDDATKKLPELRTKVNKAELEQRVLIQAIKDAGERVAQRTMHLAEAKEREAEAKNAFEEATRAEAVAAQRLAQLQTKKEQLAKFPVNDLALAREALEAAKRASYDAERAQKEAKHRVSELERTIARLKSGAPIFPSAVEATLTALREKGTQFTLLADTVAVEDGGVADAVEAALGDARFTLLVQTADTDGTIQAAREHRFPGPVYSGPRASESSSAPLVLKSGAPQWITRWVRDVAFRPDGTWIDERGTWVAPPEGHVLGAAGRRRALENAQKELEGAKRAETDAGTKHQLASEAVEAATLTVQREEARLVLLSELAALAVVQAEADAASHKLDQARDSYDRRAKRREDAHDALTEAQNILKEKTDEQATLKARLDGERAAIYNTEEEVRDARARGEELAARVRADLRIRAERGELESADTIRLDLKRAKDRFDRMPAPPPKDVREEERHLRANVEELEKHLVERQKEADSAASELTACRLRYLDVIATTLKDYRHRAVEIAGRADVKVEMELPRLTEDDRSLDEAAIHAAFGFDGKDPLPLGDPSFSGGQQVIAGLILLMAMAETDRRGFFILDEPFAHLSLDRIDQVGRFLRSTRSQFIITAPTTLDRAQLDPASAVIVLRKKRTNETHAPVPIVAEA